MIRIHDSGIPDGAVISLSRTANSSKENAVSIKAIGTVTTICTRSESLGQNARIQSIRGDLEVAAIP